MPARNTELKPDQKGRYRPYLGWKVGEDGERRQHRFNLGADRKEAERRMARLRELWAENKKAAGEPTWTPFALSAAISIARGVYKIPYRVDASTAEALEEPVAEYAQLIHVLREQFPSLEIVAADPELYAKGLRRNEIVERESLKALEQGFRELGLISPKSSLPERLVPGTLHEALDAYADHDIKKHNIKPETGQLTLYGNLRLERVERFKEHHEDLPLSALNYDRCEEIIRHWRHAHVEKKTGKITSKENARTPYQRTLAILFDGWIKPIGLGGCCREPLNALIER